MRVRPLPLYFTAGCFALILTLFVAGCQNQVGFQAEPNPATPVSNIADLDIVTGQLVFVPAYSRVTLPSSGSFRNMVVTLAIHNTDLENDIIIRSVRYYDTVGELVREFVESPVRLGAMASTGFIVSGADADTGWGTNFLVEWGAEQPVYEPVIEALIYPNAGAEGGSFLSPGRIISEQR